jgi:hypothetical protein
MNFIIRTLIAAVAHHGKIYGEEATLAIVKRTLKDLR